MYDEYASITVVAGETIAGATLGSDELYHAIQTTGVIADNPVEAIGIVQEAVNSGDHVRVAYQGKSFFIAGGSMGAGARLTVANSGYFAVATSGQAIIGRALSAVDSGLLNTGIFNFAGGLLIA